MHDWRELDFFRERGGLSIESDLLEAEVCYDYELPRESSPVIKQILDCSGRAEKAMDWIKSLPYLCRWAPNLRVGNTPEPSEHPPVIPTACLLAQWFPLPWLAGSEVQRHSIVKALAKAYSGIRPLRLYPYPLQPQIEQILSLATDSDHQLTVISLDLREPYNRLVAQFKESLLKLGIRPSRKSRSKHPHQQGARFALERLCCYRLSRIPPKERDLLADEIGFLTGGLSDAKLSHATKAVLKNFADRHYLMASDIE
jgi:hypothetical protein